MRGPCLSCCVLTPPGTGAIAVVRVLGEEAWAFVADRLVSLGQRSVRPPRLSRLSFAAYRAGEEIIDDVIVAWTRVDAVEVADISCHGGVRVVERLVLSLVSGGARWVEQSASGEVLASWSAALVACAHRLLVKTTTRRGALLLVAQAALLPECLGKIVALAEDGSVAKARSELLELLDRSRGAWHVHAGADVALVGPPNAGKSLLSNRLGGRDGSLVADRAGTTRDWVTLPTAFEGVPIRLIDTAGVRVGAMALERAAMDAGVARAGRADVTILVLDGSSPGCGDSLRKWRADQPGVSLVALNKCDLVDSGHLLEMEPDLRGSVGVVRTSAMTGEGVADLRSMVVRHLCEGVRGDSGKPVVFDAALWAALAELADDGAFGGGGLAQGIRRACLGQGNRI